MADNDHPHTHPGRLGPFSMPNWLNQFLASLQQKPLLPWQGIVTGFPALHQHYNGTGTYPTPVIPQPSSVVTGVRFLFPPRGS